MIFDKGGVRSTLECTQAGCDESTATVIELIPAADGPLLGEVKAVLSKLRESGSGSAAYETYVRQKKLELRPILHEGGRAKNPRVVSEIFYGEGKALEARAIASALEPVLGRVKPKAWPGKTYSDVVVVTGSERAPSR